MVDIETNPLYYAAAGGIILGIATSLHYILKGNVTGMSGILFDVAFFNLNEFPNKLVMIGGILMASGIFFDIFGYGTFNKFTPFGPQESISSHTSYLGFALAGFLIGFGSKLGNGCTSGHGLCGLPRLSIRSFAAVGIFLPTAIGIATIKYYVTLGPFSEGLSPMVNYSHIISANICIGLGLLFFIVGFIIQKIHNKPDESNLIIFRDSFISFLVGFIFSCGLMVSGMTRRINILQFLWMGKDWNPSLLFVLGCGVLVNLVTFNYMIRVKKIPVFGTKLFNPDNKVIDWKLILGAVTFGLGWGIGGVCPGPVFALFSVFQVQIHIVWLGSAIFGMFIAKSISSYLEQKQKNKVQQTKKNESLTNQALKESIKEPEQGNDSIKIKINQSKRQQFQVINLDNMQNKQNLQNQYQEKNGENKIEKPTELFKIQTYDLNEQDK